MPVELRQEVSEQNRIRLEKLRALQAEGRDPYRITRYGQTHRSKEILDNFEALDGQTVSIAGRMMSRRVMGKGSRPSACKARSFSRRMRFCSDTSCRSSSGMGVFLLVSSSVSGG